MSNTFKKLRAAYEYFGDTIKMVLRSGRNKRGSVEFDGTNLSLKINDATVVNAVAAGAAVTGTLAVSGATTLTGATTQTGITTFTAAPNVATAGVTVATGVVEKTDVVTLSATEIVGTDAGDLGHAGGAILVAAPGSGYALEFVSALLIYDYDTAAYTGGTGDDLAISQGTTEVSSAIADADLILAGADKIVYVNALSAADIALTENSTLNLSSTAITQPGTAAGVIRVHIKYRVHTTGL